MRDCREEAAIAPPHLQCGKPRVIYPAAAQVAVDVNKAPFASTTVIVTTTPTFSVGKASVMLDGEVVIVAVSGVTPITEDESV